MLGLSFFLLGGFIFGYGVTFNTIKTNLRPLVGVKQIDVHAFEEIFVLAWRTKLSCCQLLVI